ncbi:MAG: hypothetical protein IPM69_19205 [Ignavibacteria bacterium]|nr:hypothetical protein [Ignavibacteria bacterium]
MKTLLSIVLLTTALFGFAKTTAKQKNFTLKPENDTISINVGETAVFTINITAFNGFDASIFIDLKVGSPQMQSSSVALTNSIVNVPYTGVKLTVTTSKLFTKGGVYSFEITATNDESFPSAATCYVRVIPDTRSQWRFVKIEESLTYKTPRFILQDSEGYYWFNNQKQNKDTPIEEWGNRYTPAYGPTQLPIVIDLKNKVWVADSWLGVVRYNLDGTNKTVYTAYNSSLPDNHALALAMDRSTGTIWTGTRNGLARFEGKDWVVLNSGNTNSVMGNDLISSIVVSGSIMWIGTSKGLVKYDGKEWKRFTPENSGMPAPYARVFAVESNGDVWMGLSRDTIDNGIGENGTMIGLAKFDGTAWTLFDNKNSPLGARNYVNSVAIDKKGNKWISTCGHQNSFTTAAGIVKFDNTSWTSYTMQKFSTSGK